MVIAWLAMISRIFLMAVEKICVRLMGDEKGNLDKNIATTFVFFIVGTISLLPFLFLAEISDFKFLIPCFLSSLIYSFSFVFYVMSLATGETSLVTPINSLNSAVILFMTFVFLGEKISFGKFGGIFLIVAGISILKGLKSPLKSVKSILDDKACRYMLLSVVLLSTGRTVDKAFLPEVDPILYSVVLYFLISVYLAIFLLFRKKGGEIKHMFVRRPLISISGGIINGISYLLLLFAMQKIELSIAEPLTNVSIIITMILSALFFKESIKEKIPGGILIIFGGILLATNMYM